MRHFAHLINPFRATPPSDLVFAQPVTFATLKTAKEFARGKVAVTLLSAQYPEDRSVVPDGFELTRDLDRSVLDVGLFQRKRKLPLLVDLLDRLYEASDAEHLIYSGLDIAVMPHFYAAVDRIVAEGHDAFVINRRTISDHYRKVEDIPFMYAEIGQPHEGYDCFVFERAAYPRYKQGLACIGIPWFGRALLWNLVCNAKNFTEYKTKHLTFHLGPGNDRPLYGEEHADYRAHNIRELLNVLAALEDEHGPFDLDSPLAPYLVDIRDVLGDGRVHHLLRLPTRRVPRAFVRLARAVKRRLKNGASMKRTAVPAEDPRQ